MDNPSKNEDACCTCYLPQYHVCEQHLLLSLSSFALRPSHLRTNVALQHFHVKGIDSHDCCWDFNRRHHGSSVNAVHNPQERNNKEESTSKNCAMRLRRQEGNSKEDSTCDSRAIRSRLEEASCQAELSV